MPRPPKKFVLYFCLPVLCLAAGAWLLLPQTDIGPAKPPALAAPRLEGLAPEVKLQIRESYQELKESPENARLNGKLGMVLQVYEQYAAAADYYRRALSLHPNTFEWEYYLAIVLLEQGQTEDAIHGLGRALALRNYNPARLKLADALLEAGNTTAALEFYQGLLEAKQAIAYALYGMGQAYTNLGETERAIGYFSRALTLFPEYSAVHYSVALLYRKQGDRELSERHIRLSRQFANKQPPSDDPLMAQLQYLDRSARGYAFRGRQLLAQGKIKPAVSEFERALALDPNYVSVNSSLVFIYWQLGEPEKARSRYLAAVKTDPNAVKAHINYGLLLSSQLRYAEAATLFEKAIAANPYNAVAYGFLGYMHEEMGSDDQAMAYYSLALDNDPNQQRANFLRGRQWLKQDELARATDNFEAALAIHNDKQVWFLHQTGKAYLASGHPDTARAYLLQARTEALRQPQNRLLPAIEADLKAVPAQ